VTRVTGAEMASGREFRRPGEPGQPGFCHPRGSALCFGYCVAEVSCKELSLSFSSFETEKPSPERRLGKRSV